MTATFRESVGLWQVVVTTYTGQDYTIVRRPASITSPRPVATAGP